MRRRRVGSRLSRSEDAAETTLSSDRLSSIMMPSLTPRGRRSVSAVFAQKMEEDMLEIPLLPLKEGELEARLKDMDTTQVKFMIPRIAMLNQDFDYEASVTGDRGAVEAAKQDGVLLEEEDLALVRPNAEVIREIREIKKLQFRCGVAIVLVMIVGVLVMACGIGFIIFHAAKLNKQIDTAVKKLASASDLLEREIVPILKNVEKGLDKGMADIDTLVNTHVKQIVDIINGDDGVAEKSVAKDVQRTINGIGLGKTVLENKKRAATKHATSKSRSTSEFGKGCTGCLSSMVNGIKSKFCCGSKKR